MLRPIDFTINPKWTLHKLKDYCVDQLGADREKYNQM